MDEMTNEQYNDFKETLLLLVIEMMENSETLEEAIKKVEALLPEKN